MLEAEDAEPEEEPAEESPEGDEEPTEEPEPEAKHEFEAAIEAGTTEPVKLTASERKALKSKVDEAKREGLDKAQGADAPVERWSGGGVSPHTGLDVEKNPQGAGCPVPTRLVTPRGGPR